MENKIQGSKKVVPKAQSGDLFADQPEHKLSRRKLVKYKKNPFIDDELITQLGGKKKVYYTENTPNAIVDLQSGEISATKLQIIKTVQADKENFVKLFTTHLKVFFELSQNTFKLLHYVIYLVHKTAQDEDQIYLNYEGASEFFAEHNTKFSRTSYFTALKELCEKKFLGESTKVNLYFINPKLFFNGDRIEWITRIYKEEEKPTTYDEKKKAIESNIEEKELIKEEQQQAKIQAKIKGEN